MTFCSLVPSLHIKRSTSAAGCGFTFSLRWERGLDLFTHLLSKKVHKSHNVSTVLLTHPNDVISKVS